MSRTEIQQVDDFSDFLALDRVVDRPRPGYFAKRLYHGGPKIPARLWRDPCYCNKYIGVHPWTQHCEIEMPLKLQVMDCPITTHSMAVLGVWNGWFEIELEEYTELMERAEWNGVKED